MKWWSFESVNRVGNNKVIILYLQGKTLLIIETTAIAALLTLSQADKSARFHCMSHLETYSEPTLLIKSDQADRVLLIDRINLPQKRAKMGGDDSLHDTY